MTKKKVLIITPWYPTPSHPVEGVFVQDQALALSDEYDVYVLALVLTDWKEILSPARELPGQKNIHLKMDRFYTLPGARYFYSLYLYFYRLKLEKVFSGILPTWGKPDVIHAHIVLPSGAAALHIGGKHKIPVVLTEHTEPFSLHLRTAVCQRLTRQTLLGMDKIIAVSPSLKRQVLDFEPDAKIDIIGNVIDETFFSLTPPTQKKEKVFRFLTIALLSERKGIGYLIKAIRSLSMETSHAFELVIGGDGPMRTDLERQAEKSGVMKYCKFTGILNRTEVRDWMHRSDVFVLPSLGETFGVVLLEAMLCGKPVIATRCGGPEDLVTPETGVLVDVANSAALANAMNDLMENQNKFNPQEVRKSAIERYGQTTFLRKIAQIYDAL